MSSVVEEKKKSFAELKALPSIIVSPPAMKVLTQQNNLLEFEDAHEKSSVSFDPVFKNMYSTGIDSQIHLEYEELVGELSNISLHHDITVGTMQSLMDHSIISDPDPEDVTAFTTMLEENVDKAQKAVKKMQQHKTQLTTARNNLEESAIQYQANLDALNDTLAKRDKTIAQQSAQIKRINRDIEMISENKEQEVVQLNEDLEKLREETEILRKEDRSKIPAEFRDLQKKAEVLCNSVIGQR